VFIKENYLHPAGSIGFDSFSHVCIIEEDIKDLVLIYNF